MLDLLILRNDGQWLELELKTKSGKLSKEQSAISDGMPPIRSYQDFVSVVDMWCASCD